MKPAFELKSTQLNALALRFAQADLDAVRAQLAEKAAKYRQFAKMPLVADFEGVNADGLPDLAALKDLFAEFGLPIAAWRRLPERARAEAEQAGWLCLDGGGAVFAALPESEAEAAAETQQAEVDKGESKAETETAPDTAEVPRRAEVEVLAVSAARPTVVVDTPVRTGQQVYAENADLIVLGMVSEGAEVIADGNIHVYAPMRGRALAGEKGDQNARIFIQSMQAELVSVAGIYRVFEQNLPAHLHRQAVRIELSEGRLAVSAIDAH